MVAFLPIPIKNSNTPQLRLDEEWRTNREVLNEVLWRVLQPLTVEKRHSTESGYYNNLFADGNSRHCKPVLAAWIADCPENSDLHHLKWHVCFWCECPKKELVDYVHPDYQHPRCDHNQCRMLTDANTKAADAELSLCHVHPGFNVFRHILCIVSDHHKLDHHHTMHIGMLDHLQK